MNKYNSKIGKLFSLFFNKNNPYAVTIGQTSYFSCAESKTNEKWRKHEDTHKMQWKRDGKVKFLSRYIWQWVTVGYEKIDYEIEARRN